MTEVRAQELESAVTTSVSNTTNHWLSLLVKPKKDIGVNTFALDEVY
jgi:hypothetical protein